MSGFPRLPEGTLLSVGSHAVTIIRYLSEGGFAHIYEVKIATEDGKGRIGCLKRVIVPDKGGLNQLRKEVDVMKTLRKSRSIVQYYDSHAERLENGTYQVLVLMELCPNKSLLDYMNAKIKTKLTEPEILKIMKDIGIGVYEMHKKYLIHRDIKIENVLIDAKHHFKLCDFGSTSLPLPPPADQQQMNILAHDIMYQTTPQYRAPEMIDLYRGYPIDHKADIWALGCFLYKLCYYTTPFEAHGDIAILHASYQFPPTPAYSGDLKNIIVIMLQDNPMMRPTIVQVLMLVAKMLRVDFAEWNIKDFYGTGEYNFHALSEYQRQRQEEMMKQHQMYYNQNQQQNQNQNIRKPEQIRQQQHEQHEQHEQQHQTQQQQQEAKERKKSQEPLTQQHSSASSDSFTEIPDIDNINERYPSVENLLADINSEKPLERSSREGTDKTGELHKSFTSRALSKHSVDESVKTRTEVQPEQPKEGHKLQSKEAWETHKSYIDKNAEQLADDIFARPHSTAPRQDARSSTDLQRTVSEGAAAHTYDPVPVNNHIESEPKREGPSIKNQVGKEHHKVDEPFSPSLVPNMVPVNSGPISGKQSVQNSPEVPALGYFSPQQEVRHALEITNHQRSASNNIIPTYEIDPPPLPVRKNANPWKDYTVQKPDKALETQFDGLQINVDTRARSSHHAKSSADPNLIDLEVGLESSSSSISGPEVIDGKDDYTQTPSLIDLDVEETKFPEKPQFKKRISSAQNPGSMSLQEEVIDFASDDENPENQSNMSRLSIRNSLSKKRSKEHRKS